MPSVFAVISAVCCAVGLSAAAGLNAFIPLVIVGILQNRQVIELAQPWDVMGRWWVIGVLVVLLGVEIVVDKIPGIDHVNDVVQTLVRPAAGAVLFAAQMGHVAGGYVMVWAVLGLVVAGAVHAGKMLSRPIVNIGTAVLGAPIASLIEDMVSMTLSIVALMVPVLALVLMGVFGWMLVKLFRRQYGGWRKERRVYRVRAVRVAAAGKGS